MSIARVAQYRQLVKEAAKQLRCKPTSELARHVATLRLARSTYAERLVAGRDIDPAALLRIDEGASWCAVHDPDREVVREVQSRV